MQEVLRNWINEAQYQELMEGVNNCPHKLLGMHDMGDGKGFIVYRPQAWSVEVINEETGFREELERIDDRGLFGKYFENISFDTYTLAIRYGDNDVVITADPYSFEPYIGEMDRYLFGEGNHYEIYEKLGAHPMTYNGVEGTYFAVWAPNARSVSVIGDFNMWDSRLHQMRTLDVSGIYEIFIPGVKEGAIYKYFIRTRE